MPLVVFDPYVGPYQLLPLQSRVDLGDMAIKECSAFPKAPALLEPLFSDILVVYLGHLLGGYPSAKVQLVYSTAPGNWANKYKCI